MRLSTRRRSSAGPATSLMGWIENVVIVMAVTVPLFGMALAKMNPPPREGVQVKMSTEPTPLSIEMRWENKLSHDIDINVACFNLVNGEMSNPILVYYGRTSEKWLTLIKDATGFPRSSRNVEEVRVNPTVLTVPENSTCRVNAHIYNRHGGELPVRVSLIAIANKDAPNQALIAQVFFPISQVGEECTVLSITWDERGEFIPASVETYPKLPTVRISPAAAKDAPTCTPTRGGAS